jgi:hypothetical protein
MSSGTFAALCTNAQCFVSNRDTWGPVYGSVDVSSGILTISKRALPQILSEIAGDTAAFKSSGTTTIDWMVIAERKDPYILRSGLVNNNGHLITEVPKDVQAPPPPP